MKILLYCAAGIIIYMNTFTHNATASTNSSVSVAQALEAQNKEYYAGHGGWETQPLEKMRQQAELAVQSDFSPAGLSRYWQPDGVIAESKSNGVTIALTPEAAADGKKWGVLWLKTPVSAPFAAEVEFTLDPACPHDANLFWGQSAPSNANLGQAQKCYLAGYFGWGGKSCGIERASDWQSFGITGALDPKPGVKRTALWIVDGMTQCLYLDGVLAIYAKTPENPPASGYFGLGIYQSKVQYHSLKLFKLAPPLK
jgi:hypothetical protein